MNFLKSPVSPNLLFYRLLSATSLSLCFLFSTNSLAETFEKIDYHYYLISPHHPSEIKAELWRNSPIQTAQGTFNGHTDWHINWYYQTRQNQTGCQLYNLKTMVDIVHTLPALSSDTTLQSVITVFNKFNQALVLHEQNHGKNGLAAAKEIDHALGQIKPMLNCHRLNSKIQRITRQIIEIYSQKDEDYDRRTQNGFTEGAVIDWL